MNPENSPEEDLKFRRRLLQRSLERTRRRLLKIDLQLLPFPRPVRLALEGRRPLTGDLFRQALEICLAEKMPEAARNLRELFAEIL